MRRIPDYFTTGCDDVIGPGLPANIIVIGMQGSRSTTLPSSMATTRSRLVMTNPYLPALRMSRASLLTD